MSERWRPIPGTNYDASNAGRIRNRATGHALKPVGSGQVPYLRVSLGRSGGTRLVHRLVAEAFFGPLPVGAQVRHLDGDPANCAVANLRVGTQVENEADKRRHGRTASGERNGYAKLTAEQVAQIRALPGEPRDGSVARLAAQFGISRTHAYNLRNGKWWS